MASLYSGQFKDVLCGKGSAPTGRTGRSISVTPKHNSGVFCREPTNHNISSDCDPLGYSEIKISVDQSTTIPSNAPGINYDPCQEDLQVQRILDSPIRLTIAAPSLNVNETFVSDLNTQQIQVSMGPQSTCPPSPCPQKSSWVTIGTQCNKESRVTSDCSQIDRCCGNSTSQSAMQLPKACCPSNSTVISECPQVDPCKNGVTTGGMQAKNLVNCHSLGYPNSIPTSNSMCRAPAVYGPLKTYDPCCPIPDGQYVLVHPCCFCCMEKSNTKAPSTPSTADKEEVGEGVKKIEKKSKKTKKKKSKKTTGSMKKQKGKHNSASPFCTPSNSPTRHESPRVNELRQLFKHQSRIQPPVNDAKKTYEDWSYLNKFPNGLSFMQHEIADSEEFTDRNDNAALDPLFTPNVVLKTAATCTYHPPEAARKRKSQQISYDQLYDFYSVNPNQSGQLLRTLACNFNDKY